MFSLSRWEQLSKVRSCVFLASILTTNQCIYEYRAHTYKNYSYTKVITQILQWSLSYQPHISLHWTLSYPGPSKASFGFFAMCMNVSCHVENKWFWCCSIYRPKFQYCAFVAFPAPFHGNDTVYCSTLYNRYVCMVCVPLSGCIFIFSVSDLEIMGSFGEFWYALSDTEW